MARLGFGTRTSRTGLPEPDWYRPPLMYLAIVHLKRTKWCSEEWNMYELSRLLGFVFLPTKVLKVQRKRFDWSGQLIKKCCTSQKTIAVFCYIVKTQSSWDLRYTSSTFRFSRKVSRISEERSYAVCAVKFWENTFFNGGRLHSLGLWQHLFGIKFFTLWIPISKAMNEFLVDNVKI